MKNEVLETKSKIEIFNNEEFGQIRTIVIDGEPWFVAKDVCDILGTTNPTMAMDGLEDFERAKFNLGRQGEANIISESGFYTLVLRSRKPIAKPFRIWVTSEVLPSIRKHGAYATNDTIDKIISNPDYGIMLLQNLKEEREKREEAERRNAILSHVNKTYTMTEIAKELGLRSANELNKWLSDMHIQYKVNGTWVMYSDYSDKGYEDIKQEVLDSGRVVYHRKITQIGREFIINIFQSRKYA